MKKLTPIFLLLLTSCDLLVDVKVPYDGDKVVMNAIQSADSLWTVELTRSRYILAPYNRPGAPFFPIDFAQVTITGPDGTTDHLQLEKSGSGRFIGTARPERGKTYKISVIANGLDPVEAEMKMPPIVHIVNIEWDSSNMQSPTGPNDYSAVHIPFKVTFNDPPDEKNFYAVEVFQTMVHHYTDPRTNTTYYDTTFQELGVHIEDPGIASRNDGRQWFADDIFEGKSYVAPMRIDYFRSGRDETIELQVRLTSMSEEYFRYLETIELNAEVDGDPFAQPVQVYSNTTNGFGIFAGATYDRRVYKAN